MLNVFMIVSNKFCGRVCCDAFSRSFFSVLELYLWYNHTTSVSNDCGGVRDCVCCVCLCYIVAIAI